MCFTTLLHSITASHRLPGRPANGSLLHPLLLTLLIGIPFVFLQPVRAAALFQRIADTHTPLPGGTGNFSSFADPVLDDGDVAFFAAGASNQQGLFLDDGVLGVVVARGMPIPEASGNFDNFGGYSLDGGQVAFRAIGSSASSAHRGIYADQDGLLRVADLSLGIPSGSGVFTDFRDPSISAGAVVFRGFGTGLQQGIYRRQGTLSRVVDKNDLIPAGTGAYTGFGDPFLEAGAVTFWGGGASGQQGIYTKITTTVVVANRSTPIPDGAGNFAGFDSFPVTSGNDTAYVGLNAFFLDEGVYLDSELDGLIPVADIRTLIPAGAGNFADFGNVSLDAGDVVFLGLNDSFSPGIYAQLSGPLQRVVASGDALDGRTVSSLGLSRLSLSNRQIAFRANFSNNTQGVYLATVCTGGDMDQSDTLDLVDLPLFIDVLLDPDATDDLLRCAADLNGDSEIDARDIPDFISALISP